MYKSLFLLLLLSLTLSCDGAGLGGGGETAIPVDPGQCVRISNVRPVDCRLVRKITHAPIDGRTDTRYPSGPVHEWIGYYGDPTTNYRLFNGNNGLHITLAGDGFNALQIRGGWQGKLYAGGTGLREPAPTVSPLREIRPEGETYHTLFTRPVDNPKLSFFYTDDERRTSGRALADAGFLRFSPGVEEPDRANAETLHLAGPTVPAERLQQAIATRFRAEDPIRALGAEAGAPVFIATNAALHLLTLPQDPSSGIAAVGLRFTLSGPVSNAVVTLEIHDVLDSRRTAMWVDVLVPGPGAYHVILDPTDLVFLPPEDQWPAPPRLGAPVAPPPVLWLSVSADAPLAVDQLDVTLYRIPREEALAEAGPWRKLLLKGLFSTMSENRPWMYLKDIGPVREQIENGAEFQRYKPQLYELLENAEIARLLLPDDDIVRQYHEWLYQNINRHKPQPPPVIEQVPGAPEWAILLRQTWRELAYTATWWLDNRLVPNGEMGRGPNDDTDMYQTWQCFPWIENEPLGTRLREASAMLTDTLLEHHLEQGINRTTKDALHAYEEGVNQLALNAWWFYGDPVHFERAMASAKSVSKLMVETEDGRVHFGSDDIGIEQARNGYETIGTTPGTFSWAPVRFMLHPVYVVSWYNRNPEALGRFKQWGESWASYQKPNAFVDQVDIASGTPTGVTRRDPADNISPVTEFLALYQVTGDPAWQGPFEMGLDTGGYLGEGPKYGRMAHALVSWPEPYQSILNDRVESGYAGFFLTKDRSRLDQHLKDAVSWFGRFRHMQTAAEQSTDRVLNHRAAVPISCYLGDAPNRNTFLNFTAVSYEGLHGEEYAALVWEADSTKLKVAIYNFTDEHLAGLVRAWRLDHGRYRVRTGPDADDNGTMDEIAREEEMELQRFAPIELKLQPKQVTILEIVQLEKLDDILERADLALSPIDTRLASDGSLDVKVHNIGAKPAAKVHVELRRKDRAVAMQTLDWIEDPHDLEPRIATIRFDQARPGDEIVVDPDDSIPEIAEHNNRLRVQELSGSSP